MRRILPFVLAVTSGCMQTQSASLGSEEQHAPTLDGRESDRAVSRPDDASATVERAPHDDLELDGEDHSQQERKDPSDEVHTADAGVRDASVIGVDAKPGPEAAQVAEVDAAERDAALVDASRDATSSEDAGQPVNPLCRIEPWHCL